MPLPPLRREILLAFSLLVGAALLISATALVVVFPRLRTPGQDLFFIASLVAVNVSVVIVFGRRFLNRSFVRPVEEMVQDTSRIASGDFAHRIGAMPSTELEAIRESVNALADRLVRDQERLAENVRSLDLTNTELVETRDELIRVARLASVGTLASGIAHEVGNPLGALIGFADLEIMRAERDGRDPELIEAIRSEAERIDRIVRTLLEFARGRGGADAGPVDVGRVVEQVLDLLESQGRLNGFDVRFESDADVPRILGREQQVEQILLNLALNAIDALSGTPGPSIDIRLEVEEGGWSRGPRRRDDDPAAVDYTHRRRVATDDQVGGPDALHTAVRVVVLSVRDNGPGIDPDRIDSVFDPFFTTKDPGKGTGMGLAICARLADGMGGRIQVESPPGGGAHFTVRLPAHTPTGGERPPSAH
jgi:signal transduction histidine kinase